jgi:hypothetical protein
MSRFLIVRGVLIVCTAVLLLVFAIISGEPIGLALLAAFGGSVLCGYLMDALKAGYDQVYRDRKGKAD